MENAMRLGSCLIVALTAMLSCTAGCDVQSIRELIQNQTATFGPPGAGEQAGAPINSGLRGTIQVEFENLTPFRAIFTYGTFDNTDERSTPAFFQFSADSQFVPPGTPATLEGLAQEGPIDLPCARIFSVGSRSLINLIAKNPGPTPDLIDEPALLDGVGFSDAELGTPGESDPDQGYAAGFEARLGVDFECGDLLSISLDFNDQDANNFRVDLEMTPGGAG
jgi:hypothetical protein